MQTFSPFRPFLDQVLFLSFLVYLLTLQLIDIDSSAVTPINWSTSWLWQIGASEKTNKNSINVYYYTIKTMSRLGGFFKQEKKKKKILVFQKYF